MTYKVTFKTYAGHQLISLEDNEASGPEDAIVKATLGLASMTGVELPEDASFVSVEWEGDSEA